MTNNDKKAMAQRKGFRHSGIQPVTRRHWTQAATDKMLDDIAEDCHVEIQRLKRRDKEMLVLGEEKLVRLAMSGRR